LNSLCRKFDFFCLFRSLPLFFLRLQDRFLGQALFPRLKGSGDFGLSGRLIFLLGGRLGF